MVNFEAEKIEIERVLKRIEAAENRKDVDAMFEEMTEDSILQKCGAPQIQGRDAFRKDYEQFFKSGFFSTSITCLEREVSASGDMAWEYGSFISEFEGTDGRTKSAGTYLGVMKKVDGKWKSAAVSII